MYGKNEAEVKEHPHRLITTIDRLSVGDEKKVGKDSDFSSWGDAFNL